MSRAPARRRNLLVVATADFVSRAIRRELASLHGIDGLNVRVVAPAWRLSTLEWVTNDEDDEWKAAWRRAEHVATEAAGVAERTETRVGDSDVVQAIEDELRTFPADELLILMPPDDERRWLEDSAAASAFARIRLPTRYVVLPKA